MAASRTSTSTSKSPDPPPTLLDLTLDDFRLIVREEIARADALAAPVVRQALAPDVTRDPSADTKAIVLHDRHRQSLELLFGGPILDTGDDVVSFASRLAQFSLTSPDPEKYTPVVVTLPLDTLERLDSRRPLDTTMAEMLIPAIENFIERYINGDV